MPFYGDCVRSSGCCASRPECCDGEERPLTLKFFRPDQGPDPNPNPSCPDYVCCIKPPPYYANKNPNCQLPVLPCRDPFLQPNPRYCPKPIFANMACPILNFPMDNPPLWEPPIYSFNPTKPKFYIPQPTPEERVRRVRIIASNYPPRPICGPGWTCPPISDVPSEPSWHEGPASKYLNLDCEK